MTIPIFPPSCSSHSPSQGSIKLYPHVASTLVPLLRAHLPRSLPVLTTILENLSALDADDKSDLGTGIESGLGEKSYLKRVYATFRPESVPAFSRSRENGGQKEQGDQGVWGVVVRMQEEQQIHLRFYCSAERDDWDLSNPEEETRLAMTATTPSSTLPATPRPIANKYPPVKAGGIDLEDKEERAKTFVNEVAKAMVGIYGRKVVLGAIDSRWNEAMRHVFESRELAECTVFLAPSVTSGGDGTDLQEAEREDARLREMGLEVDQARQGDVEMIKKTCDVPRPFEYYLSRCPHTTVIRQSHSPHLAVCWIIHHADGALGALYTLPGWRRKGLAAITVRRRMIERNAFLSSFSSSSNLPSSFDVSPGSEMPQEGKLEEDLVEGESKGLQDFCYVFRGNIASEGLWRKLGWTEGWGVRWIVNSEAEKDRGRVERFHKADT